LVALAWVIFAGRPVTVRAQDRYGDWTIDYHTYAVKVLTVEKPALPANADWVLVTVQNVSRRPITYLNLNVGPATYHYPAALRPGAAKTVEIDHPQIGADRVIRFKAVLFGDGPAAADGDAEDIEWMRFERLGEALESSRCVAIFSALDSARPDDESIDAAIRSLARQPKWPLEKALGSLPASPLKGKLPGATASAKMDFLTGFDMSWGACHTSLQQLLRQPDDSPGSGESRRARSFSEAITAQRAAANEYLTASNVDMGVAN
jgi:hypothetical protein